MEEKNKKCKKFDEKEQKNASKIEKTENSGDLNAENGVSRTRMHAVYVQHTKEETRTKRGGRMGIRER